MLAINVLQSVRIASGNVRQDKSGECGKLGGATTPAGGSHHQTDLPVTGVQLVADTGSVQLRATWAKLEATTLIW